LPPLISPILIPDDGRYHTLKILLAVTPHGPSPPGPPPFGPAALAQTKIPPSENKSGRRNIFAHQGKNHWRTDAGWCSEQRKPAGLIPLVFLAAQTWPGPGVFLAAFVPWRKRARNQSGEHYPRLRPSSAPLHC